MHLGFSDGSILIGETDVRKENEMLRYLLRSAR